MQFYINVKILVFFCLLCAWANPTFAQTPERDLRMNLGQPYRMDNGFSILHNNQLESVKIKEFQVAFYDSSKKKIVESEIEVLPIAANGLEFNLDQTVSGFFEVGITIISVYDGDPNTLPDNPKNMIGLNLVPEVEIVSDDFSSTPIDQNPVKPDPSIPMIAMDGHVDIEAMMGLFKRDISDLYSSADLSVRLIENSGTVRELSYQFEPNGMLALDTPKITGEYSVPYQIENAAGLKATGNVKVSIRIPDNINSQLTKASDSIEALLEKIERDLATLNDLPTPSEDLQRRLAELTFKNEALLSDLQGNHDDALKDEVSKLSNKLANAEFSSAREVYKTSLEDVKSEIQTIQASLKESVSDGTDIQTLNDDLQSLISAPLEITTKSAALTPPLSFTSLDIKTWTANYEALKARVPVHWSVKAAIAIGAALLIGCLLKVTGIFGGKGKLVRGSSNSRTERIGPKHSSNAGVIFPSSPLLVANVVAPLGTAGQLTASQLQMLTGPYTVLRLGYEATGRIGYAQDGIPGAEDYSFGTGFLVTDRHVVTNRHVYGLYGHYLLNAEDPGGIEFIAEKGKEASDFIAFNGDPPLLIPQLDIAIFTLSRPVTKRKPLEIKPRDALKLDGRDIVVIGYPDTHTPENPEILSVVETDPVFAVKRLSRGKIFRHSTDIDTPYGVQTSVTEDENTNFDMPAICHNASTLGGNSGSPLLDLRTGALLGVHFAGFKVFNQKEAANLAMTIAQLAECGRIKDLNS